jgi:glyoxylase I family protein
LPRILSNSHLIFIGIDHTAIASLNPLRLANWYVEHLGFNIVAQSQGKYFIRAQDETLLEIIPGEGHRVESKMTDLGVRHVALRVNDFDGACEHLRSFNLEFLTDPIYVADLDLRLIFFRDLDGNILHLIHRGPGGPKA